MSEPPYTVEKANALLPHLAPALVELRERYEAAQAARRKIAGGARTNGSAGASEAAAPVMRRVDELLKRIRSWGVELRDLESGLVDFPATLEGRDAYLCWRLGEAEVAHWHPVDEGFAGRRPLP